MRVMTYNIYEGGALCGMEAIARVIAQHNPDVVCLQETQPLHGPSRLQTLLDTLKMPHFVFSDSEASRFPVGIISKFPIMKFKEVDRMRNGCLIAQLESSLGNISVASAHLHPHGEYYRVNELEHILGAIRNGESLIVGDFNALSSADNYPNSRITKFSAKQRDKFCIDGQLQHGATNLLREVGYVDVAVVMGKNRIATAPTPACKDPAHASSLRIDYVWISQGLVGKVKSYRVVRNESARQASDHYPIVVDLA